MRVAVRRFDFDDALTDFQDRDVERAAAEIVDGNRLILLFVETVRECGGGGLVHEAAYFEAGDLSGVLGRLALRVVEIGRNGDDGLRHRLAEILLRGLFQLLQNHRGDLRRRVQLSARFDASVAVGGASNFVRNHLHLFAHFVVLPTHEPFDGEDGVFGIGDRLSLRYLADEAFAILGEPDDGGREPAAFGVDDDFGLVALHHRDDGVRRPEVNANNLGHNLFSLSDLERY